MTCMTHRQILICHPRIISIPQFIRGAISRRILASVISKAVNFRRLKSSKTRDDKDCETKVVNKSQHTTAKGWFS